MGEFREGWAKIVLTPRNSGVPIELDWDKWDLTRSINSLHKFTCNPILDSSWIDFESETGFKTTIGDEVEFWATFGDETGGDSKRFGGYIQSIEGEYNQGTQLNLNCNDYRYLLQRMEVFKDYYKLMTVSLSQYANYVQRLYNANTLSEAIYYLCSAVGFTDFSQLDQPYAFLAPDDTTYTNTAGIANDTLFNGFPQEPGYPYHGSGTHWLEFYGGNEVAFTVYEDSEGYDAINYPYLTLNLLNNMGCEFGLRITVNGSYVYIPWYSDLSGYTGVTKTEGLAPNVYNTKTNIVIPLKELLDGVIVNYTYMVTKIEIVNYVTGGVPSGSIFVSKFGAVDPYQALPMRHEYIHMNGYELADMLATDCNHYFTINPYKQPVIYNNQKRVTSHSIIEGENLITSNVTYDDDDLVNNYMCISNQENNNVIFGQEVDLEGINRNGRYDRIDEESDITDVYGMKVYAEDMARKLSKLVPTYECTITPNFEMNEGELVYVYNPSLGVEKSLYINEITISSDGTCRVTLGLPPATLISYLKKLTKRTGSLNNRTNKAYNELTKTNTNISNLDFQYAVGEVNLYGSDIVAPGIDLNEDRNSYGALLWKAPSDVVTIDNSGVDLYRPSAASLSEFNHIISAVPLNNPKFKYIKKVTVDYEYTGFYNSIIMGWSFYSNYDITDNTKNQMYSTYSTVLSGKSNASGSGSVVIYEKNVSPKDLPPVPYYHLDLSFFTSSNPGWYGHFKVTGIRTEYVAENGG